MLKNNTRFEEKNVIDILNIMMNKLSIMEEKIKLHWSPDQLASREQNEVAKLPSTSTIYRMIHNGKIGKIEKIRMCHLRRKGKFKGHTYRQVRFDYEGRAIRMRAKEIYKREEVGHWEGDTIDSGKNGSKVKLVLLQWLRETRYCIVIKVENKTSEIVSKAIIEAMKNLPETFVKTITFDRGLGVFKL